MSNNVVQTLNTAAFGALSVAEDRPLIQVTAQYGILDDILTAVLGGTATTADSKFIASTGTGANNVAAIVSSREAQYKAGQGLKARFTAIFTAGVPNSGQEAGLITSESAFAFGYNGSEFGILHATGGSLEDQDLEITSGATGAENATITVDGVPYTVALSNSTAEQNAYEIAVYLNANEPRYRFTSNGVIVTALARLPDFGVGAFAFSSATATGTWTEISNGVIPAESWTPKEEWNVNPNIDIDPTLGNVYQVQIQYLGFGGIKFYVENPETADFELVHILEYANTSTLPSVPNPIFRVGWAARNTGNTTNISVQGASAAVFNEGEVYYDGRPRGLCHTQTGIDATRTNVLALRNRLSFNGAANRAEIIPKLLSFSTDSSKTGIFEIIKGPEVGPTDFLEWQYADETLSLMEYSTSDVEITGGTPIACFTITSAGINPIDVESILEFVSPFETFAITAKVSGGAAADMDVSATWKEDL